MQAIFRRKTRTCTVGNLKIGSDFPIAIQSMCSMRTEYGNRTSSCVKLQLSTPIFEEIKRVFEYPKIRKKILYPKERLDEALAAMVRVSEWIKPEEKFHIIKNDPADNKYLECAVEGGADYIVSWDEDLLSLGNFQHTKIISTRSFLETINTLIKS